MGSDPTRSGRERETGTVRTYLPGASRGWVVPDAGGEELMFNSGPWAIIDLDDRGDLGEAEAGQRVTFERWDNRGGVPWARHVLRER